MLAAGTVGLSGGGVRAAIPSARPVADGGSSSPLATTKPPASQDYSGLSSLADPAHGAVLFDDCGGGACSRIWLSVTDDGGRTFRRERAPGRGAPSGVARLADGLIYVQRAGPIFRSVDEGRSWRAIGPAPGILTWTASGAGIWALTQACGRGRCAAPRLWHSLDTGRHWHYATLRAGNRNQDLSKPSYALSFASSAHGLVLYPTGPRGVERLGLTDDGGRSWSFRSLPCASAYEFEYRAAEAPDGAIWLACLGEPGTGFEGKQIFRSLDGGRHFELRLQAPFLERNRLGSGIDYGGYLFSGITPASEATAYAIVYRVGLARTDDGGRDWRFLRGFPMGDNTGLLDTAITAGGRIVWLDILHDGLFASADGGRRWRQLHP